MKVVNLYGGPGCGKSTTAAGVFSLLKLHGISIELSTEYAKDVTHKEAFKVLRDQLYLMGKQNHKTFIVKDKYDYVITDSPMLLSIIYADPTDKVFQDFVLDRFLKQENLNFFIERVKPYVKVGRNQTEDEARILDNKIKAVLDNNGIPYQTIKGNKEGINDIVEVICNREGKFIEHEII